jgi:hypothetical protein
MATHRPLTAFFAGAATALGAGVSMAFPEGLSDTGDLTGRGSPMWRGAVTGGGTFAGGILHTLPFLIPGYVAAISAAIAVVSAELVVLAWLRRRFFHTSFARSVLAITVGGAIIAALSSALGIAATVCRCLSWHWALTRVGFGDEFKDASRRQVLLVNPHAERR